MIPCLQSYISNHHRLRYCYGDAAWWFWLSDVPAGLIMHGFSTNAFVSQIERPDLSISLLKTPRELLPGCSSHTMAGGAGLGGVFMSASGFFVFSRYIMNVV